jgi:hypothetical protein
MGSGRPSLFSCLATALAFQFQAHAGKVELGLGSGVNIGDATRYQPYLTTERIVYIPHLTASLAPRESYRIGLTLTHVDADNFCWGCREKVNEDYWKTALEALRKIPVGTGWFLGGGLFWQSGLNTYTLKDDPVDDEFEGALTDRYSAYGYGLVTEKSVTGMFTLGMRWNFLREYSRERKNTLVQTNIGDRPVTITDSEKGTGSNLEIYVRAGFGFGY